MQKLRLRKTSIRNTLIAFIVIIFFLCIIGTYYAKLYSETTKEIIISGELSSHSAADQIDKYISVGSDTLKLSCYTVDNMIRTGSSKEEILKYMENQTIAIASTNPSCQTGLYGWILDDYLDGSGWVPEADYIPTERPWYSVAKANIGRVAIVDPYVDAMTGSVIVTFSKTLCDAKSIMSLDFTMDRLQSVTEDTVANTDVDYEIVVDQKYTVIASSDIDEIGKSYLSDKGSLGNEIVKNISNSTEDEYLTIRYNGEDYIVYVTTITNDWMCISVFNSTKIFGDLRNTLIISSIVATIMVVVLLSIMINSNKKDEQSDKLESLVEVLAASIDAKDAYTNGHSVRVADYSKEISRRYGYSAKQQEEIHMMGLLHDVGKIGIPDAIINKTGKLSDDEFRIIKTHPDIGYRILSKAIGNSAYADGARWHHERIDGRGYPDGLSGDEIPERARIIAVADSYDAMTSRRSYREALAQSIVRSEIEKGKGTQFDPVFADIMIQMIDEDTDYKMRDTSKLDELMQ